MNTMSRRRRPSSTRGSPEELSTTISVAASRGRSALRALASGFGVGLRASVMGVLIECVRAGRSSATAQTRQAIGCARRDPPCHRRLLRAAQLLRGRAAALGGRAGHRACLSDSISKRSAPADRDRLHQPHAHIVAQPVGLARAVADQRVRCLVVAIVVVADGGGRHEAVGAGVAEAHEQAGARDAGDARRELRADAVGEEGGDQPVGGLALGRHGAALGIGDRLRDVLEPAALRRRRMPPAPSPSARISERCTIRSA